MLWESSLHERFRQADPTLDQALIALWQGFERVLIDRCPDVARLYTTYEDLYDRSAWTAFLERQGYQSLTAATFAKEVARP